MARARAYDPGRQYLVRLAHGADLIDEITTFCIDEGVDAAYVSALGAVRRATISFYDQTERVYRSLELDEPLEIAALTGNVSRKDGELMLHAHIVLSKENGETLAGHLTRPSEIFACEVYVRELAGTPLTRELDEATGLPLWSELR